MFVPLAVDVPLERRPVANWLLMAVTVLVSAAALLDPLPRHLRAALADVEMWRAIGFVVPWWEGWMVHREGFRPWQLIGHQLIHADWMHLAGNMLVLWVFGNAVNAKLGNLLYIPVYFGLGGAAGLGWLAFDGGFAALGASGAIMGVVGMYLIYFPRNNVRVFWVIYAGYFFRCGLTEMSSYWLILAYIAFDLWGAAVGGGSVAYSAHLGGAGLGIVTGAAFLAAGFVRTSDTEQNLLQMVGLKWGRLRTG